MSLRARKISPAATGHRGGPAPPVPFLALWILLGLLGASVAKETSASPEKKFRKLLDDGHLAFKEKNMTRAIKRFKQALAIEPKNVDARRALGKGLYDSGRFEEAQKTFTKALGLDPTHRTTRKVLVDALAAAGSLADALWHFGQVAVSRQITLPPLSEALIPAWTAKQEQQVSEPLPPPNPAEGEGGDAPRMFFADPQTMPREALRKLRDFLSGKIVGKAYNFEFRSSSMPLAEEGAKPSSLLEQTIQQLRSLLPPFARRAARCAEWWVHRRPPAGVPAGVHRVGLESHPFHWDNDGDEALGEKPLYTSLLFMTDVSGAPSPTLVLNTSVVDGGFSIGDAAWMVHAREGRVAYFQGGMLHGVLPSAGYMDFGDDPGAPARLSINVAWWPHSCRVAEKVDSVAGVPDADALWAARLEEASPVERRVPLPTYDVFCGDDLCGRNAHGDRMEL